MGPCCEQTHAAFEVGLNLDQGQGVYSGWSDVVSPKMLLKTKGAVASYPLLLVR